MPEFDQSVFEFERALLSLDRLEARRILGEMLSHAGPLEAVEKLVVPSMERIGKGWEQGTIALSQSYMGAKICEELVDTYLPSAGNGRRESPKMAIAVLEDHHGLGKRIVYSVLRASGFNLRDYGLGVSVNDMVERVKNDSIEIILISTLMLRSALMVKEVVTRLKEESLDIKVVVGGAPFLFDRQLWLDVGADAMGRSASEAATIVTGFMEGRS